jgi:hypothetical protein
MAVGAPKHQGQFAEQEIGEGLELRRSVCKLILDIDVTPE